MAPTRRDFLRNSTLAGLGITLGMNGLSSCSTAGKAASVSFGTDYQQKPLPYAYDALESAIDARTMELHYSKHAAGYAKNLQEALQAEGVSTDRPIEALLADISRYSAKMRNNAGGHFNHEQFWRMMRPNGGTLSGRLEQALISAFGSVEAFKKQFADAASGRFGSGWAWLYVDKDRRLRIGSTPNQDTPLMNVSEIKGQPLLALDVWEHAYYLRYQNKRAEYIGNWWKVVNWEYIQNLSGKFI